MNILCDYHHGELYESILKLFEDRFGWKVYRPIGREWHDEGYWNISPGNEVCIDQYLGYRTVSTGSLEGTFIEDARSLSPAYFENVINIYGREPHTLITLESAKEFKWDIILTTMIGHFLPMEQFRIIHCPKAKHILQLGNVIPKVPDQVQNLMNSTGTDHSYVPNVVDYYQEFDTSPLFPTIPINNKKSLCTFLIYNRGHRGADFWKLHELLPDWIFREYGWSNKDGDIHKYLSQCEKIREVAFMWHVKINGDGYGYNLYRSLYAGKPPIINFGSVYKDHRLGKLGFFEDGITMIDYDGRTIEELKLELLKMHGNWEMHSQKITQRIRNLVNFDNEFEKIKTFVANLR